MSAVQPLHALNLDVNQQRTFIRYFRSLPEKPPTTIRIFNRVDYYTVHDTDAHCAAVDVFSTTAAVKVMGVENLKLDYLVLSKNNYEKFVRNLLLVKQYQVEVYAKQGSSKNQEWVLELKGSPGNLAQFEDVLFENADYLCSNVVMAVKVTKNNFLGVSFIDSNEKTFSVCEFADNEYLSQLESLIIQTNARECVLFQVSDTIETAHLRTILDKCNILCSTFKKKPAAQSASTLVQDLNRLLYFEEGQQQTCNAMSEMKLTHAMDSLHAGIIHLELIADSLNFNQFRLKIFDTKLYVHLDAAAIKSLNVFPKNLEYKGNKNTSLLGLLDCCRTAQGRRLLAQWLRRPLRDKNQLNNRLEIVEVFDTNTSLRHLLYNDYLRRFPDLLMLGKRFQRKKAKLQDVYKVYQEIEQLSQVVKELRSTENAAIVATFVEPFSSLLEDMERFQRMVEATFDLDAAGTGEYLIKSSYSGELKDLNAKKQYLEEKIQKQLSIASRDLGYEAGKTIKLEFTEQLGYFLRVTQKEEPTLRANKHYNIVGVVKGGVRFTTEKLESLNSDYVETRNMYEEQQKSVVDEVMSITIGYVDTMIQINNCVAQLDVLVSFACVSCSAPKPFVRPQLLDEGAGHMKLVRMRHPCVELQDGVSFNPNDIEFKANDCTFHIITGPNMGGKSTYIRSVGVSVLLAHIGCFVPCDEAVVPIFDSILARVGAEDCQEKGLSTFMLEMVEMAGILRTVTANSLVIIDELGRGTSTYEGCGIAWAIAEHLGVEVKAFSMFATHFHEITKLANEVPNIVNKHMSAILSDNTLMLLYQVKPGICDQSFGIHVAKMAGFSSDFIQQAIDIQNNLEDYRNIAVLQDYDANTRQQILHEGDEIIGDVINKLKHIDSDQMTDEELNAFIQKLKTNMTCKNNPYVKALLINE